MEWTDMVFCCGPPRLSLRYYSMAGSCSGSASDFHRCCQPRRVVLYYCYCYYYCYRYRYSYCYYYCYCYYGQYCSASTTVASKHVGA